MSAAQKFFLFPGQGSQAPGMGADFYERSDAARAVFDRAAAVMGPDFLDTIFRGSAEAVTDTRIAQPGLLTVGAAIAAELAARGIEPAGAAGHSLGEFTALVAAGALDFEEALGLVRERARLMHDEAPPGTMAAVVGLDVESIEAVLPEDVDIANMNGPGQTILSGTAEALERAAAVLKEAGAKRVLPLKVAGPFHSRLMTAAAEKFRAYVEQAAIGPPRCRFISSVSAQEEDAPEAIRELLYSQIASPVRWTGVMRAIGPGEALEVGPGKVLQGIAKRMDDAPSLALAGTLENLESLA